MVKKYSRMLGDYWWVIAGLALFFILYVMPNMDLDLFSVAAFEVTAESKCEIGGCYYDHTITQVSTNKETGKIKCWYDTDVPCGTDIPDEAVEETETDEEIIVILVKDEVTTEETTEEKEDLVDTITSKLKGEVYSIPIWLIILAMLFILMMFSAGGGGYGLKPQSGTLILGRR